MGCNRSSDNSMQLSPFLRCGYVRSFSCHTPIILYCDIIVKHHGQKNLPIFSSSPIRPADCLLRLALPGSPLRRCATSSTISVMPSNSPLRRSAPALPEGEPSVRPWVQANFVVRQTKNGPSCCMVTVKGAVFGLKPPRGRARRAQGVHLWAGAGLDINNAGASLTADPRRGTLSFVTQKFFCFGAINNRRNYWLGISFLLSHRMGIYPSPQTVSSHSQAPYIKYSMVPCICYK